MLKPKSIQRATKIPINQCDRLRTLVPVSDPINRVGDEPCRQAGPIQRAAQGDKPSSVTVAGYRVCQGKRSGFICTTPPKRQIKADRVEAPHSSAN